MEATYYAKLDLTLYNHDTHTGVIQHGTLTREAARSEYTTDQQHRKILEYKYELPSNKLLQKQTFEYRNGKVHTIKEEWLNVYYYYEEFIDQQCIKECNYKNGILVLTKELLDGKMREIHYTGPNALLWMYIYDNVKTEYFADGQIRKV